MLLILAKENEVLIAQKNYLIVLKDYATQFPNENERM